MQVAVQVRKNLGTCLSAHVASDELPPMLSGANLNATAFDVCAISIVFAICLWAP